MTLRASPCTALRVPDSTFRQGEEQRIRLSCADQCAQSVRPSPISRTVPPSVLAWLTLISSSTKKRPHHRFTKRRRRRSIERCLNLPNSSCAFVQIDQIRHRRRRIVEPLCAEFQSSSAPLP